ncbi:MAG: DUF4177 domain-containing protein [Rhodobacteraceae bacterium]|nr:DUF4177 domain-containing protein [Paracoccaceae bacterium]
MTRYEYKVIPAPAKAVKVKGIKTPEGRFAQTVETAINRMAEGGWEFQRAELLPSADRAGLTGTKTTWRNLLVFRRAVTVVAETEPPAPAPITKIAPTPPVAEQDQEPSPVVAIDQLRAWRLQADDMQQAPWRDDDQQ